MSWYGFIAAIFVALILFSANLEWLGIVFVVIAFAALFYPRAKKESKKAWEDFKKADAFYPEKKFLDTYSKTAGKSAAEALIPPKDTKTTAKSWIHKSSQLATNFLKELDEIFK